MALPTIDIPARLSGPFVTAAPVAADLLTLGGFNDSGAANIENGAKFAQLASLRLWEVMPETVPVGGQELLNTAWTTAQAVQTFSNAELGDKLAAISEGAFAVIDTMYDAMGIVESVPLIGIIAKIGTTVQRIFWNQWIAAHKTPPAELGIEYNRESDEYWVREILQNIETGDLTRIFAPYIAQPQNWEVREVQDLLKHGKNRWTYVAPIGDQTGIGNVPGTTSMSQAYQAGWGWGGYRPATVQAASAAWQMVMGHTRTRYLVDAVELGAMWDDYWMAVMMGSITPGSLDDDLGGRGPKDRPQAGPLNRAQRPLMPWPEGVYGAEAEKWREQQIAAGYFVWGGTYVDAYPFLKIEKAGYSPNMQGLVKYNLERKLRARQMEGLKSLLVAYVSRDDPAFRNDAELAETLETNRGILLRHVARWQVELDRVPDEDYRQALAQATAGRDPGATGGKYAAAPQGPKIPGLGLAGGEVQESGDMPTPPLGFKVESPLPMIAGAGQVGRKSGGGGGALLLLGAAGVAAYLASRRR